MHWCKSGGGGGMGVHPPLEEGEKGGLYKYTVPPPPQFLNEKYFWNQLEISLKVINTPAPGALLYSMWGNEGNEVNTKFVYWSIIHQRVLNKFTIVINKLNLHWVNLQQMEILATYYQLLSKDVLHMYTCMQ